MADIATNTLQIGGNNLILQDAAVRSSLANAYSASSTYAVGDMVLKDGQLYECNTAISTAEAWTAAHWTAVTVGGELSTVKDGLTDLETQITATLITDTASGAIASFPDGADGVPVKSLTVDIEPVQDLHGQANPYPAGGGKNKYKMRSTSTTVNGITVTANADGTISLSGTATANAQITMYYSADILTSVIAEGGTFTMSLNKGTYDANTLNVSISYRETASGSVKYITPNNPVTIPQGSIFNNSNLWIPSGSTVQTLDHFAIQFEKGSSATTFAPYENICPISGHTSAVVTRTGANVWDEVWEVGGINQDGTNAPANDIIRSKNYIPVAPNTAYYCTYGNADKIYECFFYGPDKSHISNAVLPSTGVVTTPSNCGYMRFRCRASYGATYKNDLSINYPATVTTYNAYNGQTVTIDLDGTRYGGTLDAITGVLTVDRALVSITSVQGKANTSANKEYYFTGVQNAIDATKSIISDKYPYNASPNVIYNTNIKAVGVADNGIILLGLGADGPSDMASANTFLSNNPITVCYFLKTPQTVQLSANEISTVLGQNNIWNDCGDTTVEYRADTKLYINKMLNA